MPLLVVARVIFNCRETQACCREEIGVAAYETIEKSATLISGNISTYSFPLIQPGKGYELVSIGQTNKGIRCEEREPRRATTAWMRWKYGIMDSSRSLAFRTYIVQVNSADSLTKRCMM